MQKEFGSFYKLHGEIKGAVRLAIFRVNSTGDEEEYNKFKRQYKIRDLADGKPVLRYYPNEVSGDRKLAQSFGILFDPANKDLSPIMGEIHQSFDGDVRDVTASVFNNMILHHAKEEQKHVIYLMYKDDHISLGFKALSRHPVFHDCVFFALYDPPSDYFQGLTEDLLPSIGLVKALDADFTEGEIKQTNIPGRQSFFSHLKTLAQQLGRLDELAEMYGEKPRTARAPKKRNYGEITSTKDFNERCLSFNKACAIGLLSAVTMIDYERDNLNQHLETLQALSDKAGTQPIHYSWVNVTCHPEWLKYFDVDQFQLPSVVYYFPEKELQANLIGKFDASTIDNHADRFLKGKIATWKPKVKQGEMTMEEKDCSIAAEGAAEVVDE